MPGTPDRGQPVPSATLRLPTSSTNSHAIPMECCECSVGRGTKTGGSHGDQANIPRAAARRAAARRAAVVFLRVCRNTKQGRNCVPTRV